MMIGELGVGSNGEDAEGDQAERVQLETSIKHVESSARDGQEVGEGSWNFVRFARMHAV